MFRQNNHLMVLLACFCVFVLSFNILHQVGFFSVKVASDKISQTGNTIYDQLAATPGAKRDFALKNPNQVYKVDLCDGSYNYTGDPLQLMKEISKYKNLKYLELCQVPIRVLPPDIANLTQLEYFHSISGRLTTIPPEIGKLTSLKYLSLSESQITILPPELADLKNLEELDLSFNPIIEFPVFLTKMTNLKKLYLLNTKITQIPSELKNMTSLEELDLRDSGMSFDDLTALQKRLPQHIKIIF